jgi:NAD(P)-dependent dehydrogenase (short-subunit alcohol dehydrogenase family)
MAVTRQYAIVTGAASGLGRAIALCLARDGWHVAVADLNLEAARETLDLVRSAGGDGQVERLDVSQQQEWADLAQRLQASWPQLDLLVNNAGVSGSGEVGQYTLENWRWMVEIDLWGPILGCHTMIDWLKRNPRGAHIINTASLAAICTVPTMAAYNVCKAGVLALSETLYAELKKDRIGVTVLCPSFFHTNLLSISRMQTPEQLDLADRTMRSSSFTADDVAAAAIRAMKRKRLYVILPFKGRVFWRLKRAIPEEFLWFVGQVFKKGLPKKL